jgi:hypothetical protein
MMTDTTKHLFIQLCQQAYDLDWKTEDCRDVEPLMIAILELVKAHPTQHHHFVQLFSAVDDGTIAAPDYLVAFCMRDLKFAELRDKLVQECAADQNTAHFRRRMNYISHVMHAFDDVIWEQADFWPYYAHELPNDEQ